LLNFKAKPFNFTAKGLDVWSGTSAERGTSISHVSNSFPGKESGNPWGTSSQVLFHPAKLLTKSIVSKFLRAEAFGCLWIGDLPSLRVRVVVLCTADERVSAFLIFRAIDTRPKNPALTRMAPPKEHAEDWWPKDPVRPKYWSLGDACLVSLGLCLAILIRLHDFAQRCTTSGFQILPFRFGIVLVICGISLYYNIYTPRAVVNRRSELVCLSLPGRGNGLGYSSILYYLIPEHSLGRGNAVFRSIVLLFLLSWRLFCWKPISSTKAAARSRRWYGAPRNFAGSRDPSRPELHPESCGFLVRAWREYRGSPCKSGIIGATRTLEEITSREKIDRIVLSLKERRGQLRYGTLH